MSRSPSAASSGEASGGMRQHVRVGAHVDDVRACKRVRLHHGRTKRAGPGTCRAGDTCAVARDCRPAGPRWRRRRTCRRSPRPAARAAPPPRARTVPRASLPRLRQVALAGADDDRLLAAEVAHRDPAALDLRQRAVAAVGDRPTSCRARSPSCCGRACGSGPRALPRRRRIVRRDSCGRRRPCRACRAPQRRKLEPFSRSSVSPLRAALARLEHLEQAARELARLGLARACRAPR